MIRKTKIIATIGPATASKKMLRKIIQKGVNVCRLNFSHLEHNVAKEIITNIKEINQELKLHTAILADLQGPKIRVGEFDKPIKLKKGAEVTFSTKKKKDTIYINYQGFAKDVQPKDRVLLDDGKLALEVVSTNKKNTVILKVLFGGLLQPRKGVNLPNTKISLSCLTPKDKEDLVFILAEKIEWIGLSFVRSANDVKILKKIIDKQKLHHKVIAKIEKPEAINDIDAIIDATDAIMVARGDLGVEVPPHKVPVYQKMIVEKCIAQAKPVVIATQMLESMIENPTATRAEVNDVANAIYDGVDAIMLSAETAIGSYPVEAVEMMSNISTNIEADLDTSNFNRNIIDSLSTSITNNYLGYDPIITPAKVIELAFTNQNTDPVLISSNLIQMAELAHLKSAIVNSVLFHLKLIYLALLLGRYSDQSRSGIFRKRPLV